MSTSTPREMRIVPTEEGWATAVETSTNHNLLWLFGPILLILPLAMGLTAALANFTALVVLLATTLAVLACAAIIPTTRSTRIETTAHGVRISHLFSRTTSPPTPDIVRDATPPRLSWNPNPGPDTFLQFDTIEDMGHNDFSIWFTTAEGRHEVMLNTTRRDDIERLANEIREVWERHRAGIETTEEQAASQRRQLAALKT